MTRGPFHAEPRRLATGDDRSARLLREAEQAFCLGVATGPAWKRLQARRERRRGPPAVVAALAIAAAALALVARPDLVQKRGLDFVPLTAERLPSRAPIPPASQLPRVERRIPPATPMQVRGAPTVALLPALQPSNRVPTEVMTEATCRNWSSQAHFEQAVDCFQSISRQPGLSAEVALYEAARVAAEALQDPGRALSLLDQHSHRFPSSVLRVEVEWLRVRSLERAMRLSEALTSSEALLDTPAARKLAPKLHLLRGRIYADLEHDCAQALPEYVALLGEPGPAGDEAELSRAQCLERLGKTNDARAAYERYLARPELENAALARRRLLAISNPEQPVKGEP